MKVVGDFAMSDFAGELRRINPYQEKTVMTRLNRISTVIILSTVFASAPPGIIAQEFSKVINITESEPVLWREPSNIRSRNMRYGTGSRSLAPRPPFRFIEEDKDGEFPKFKVRDAKNVEWSVKLGPEAQTETVVTRLVWSVGYFAEEAYYFKRVTIRDLPGLSRGREYVEGQNVVRSVRFEPRRKGVKRGPNWGWDKNPFSGSRELSGLKVLMIMLNNYDARTANNRILLVRDARNRRVESRYVVTDLGATLGRAGGFGERRSKNDLTDFLASDFVRGVSDGEVEFDYSTRPVKFGALTILYPPYYRGEVKKERDMRGIPVSHARWIVSLLSQLSDNQLRDAFRAAGYDRATMEGYVRAIRKRINQLTQL